MRVDSLDHVNIITSDVEGSARFYQELLGLEPRGAELVVAPRLPDGIERIELRGIPGRWGRAEALSGALPSAVSR